MPKENMGEYSSFYTPNRKLAYDNEFRESLREHPEILKTALDMFKKAADEYDPGELKIGEAVLRWDNSESKWKMVSTGHVNLAKPADVNVGRNAFLKAGEELYDKKTGLTICMLGKINRVVDHGEELGTRHDVGEYYSAEFNGHKYFIKSNTISVNPGYSEFHSNMTAKEILKDLDFVDVVSAKLGYQDNEKSWYVTDWHDLEKNGYNSILNSVYVGFNDYGNPVRSLSGTFGSKEEYVQFQSKSMQIMEAMKEEGIDQDLRSNLFYNPRTEKFIVIDCTSGNKDEMLGNALTSSREETI